MTMTDNWGFWFTMKLRLQTDLLITSILGAIEALLLARLIFKLFAARPEHPVVAWILALSEPAIALLARFDEGQPQFGATLEFSTLTLCLLIPILWTIGRNIRERRAPSPTIASTRS
jgi:hypothetical protein